MNQRRLFLAALAVFALAAPAVRADGPRTGKYEVSIYSYTGSPSHYADLYLNEDGTYEVRQTTNDEVIGKGEWSWNAADSSIEWLSGRYKENGYGGTYKVRDDGRPSIRLGVKTYAIMPS